MRVFFGMIPPHPLQKFTHRDGISFSMGRNLSASWSGTTFYLGSKATALHLLERVASSSCGLYSSNRPRWGVYQTRKPFR